MIFPNIFARKLAKILNGINLERNVRGDEFLSL